MDGGNLTHQITLLPGDSAEITLRVNDTEIVVNASLDGGTAVFHYERPAQAGSRSSHGSMFIKVEG